MIINFNIELIPLIDLLPKKKNEKSLPLTKVSKRERKKNSQGEAFYSKFLLITIDAPMQVNS